MCLSAHEMTAERIQTVVDGLTERLQAADLTPAVRQLWTGRLAEYKKLLHELTDGHLVG